MQWWTVTQLGLEALSEIPLGQVVGAFSKKLSGSFSSFTAECSALREGLRKMANEDMFAAESPLINYIKILIEEAGGGFCGHISR
ncbi:hypothetical protein TIFTF001_054593 [Ficus carica]|uniref:Uncharacterized protein n=1 Tax=Ficus carica TaxID=3494 RepID=A0AA88EKH0_FICCA|nr:hypothetical protein TIFTF001_054592 [Ficus carica]GMN71269.1 hypothetical protein TIFTF001_054593 [Ficus carica]